MDLWQSPKSMPQIFTFLSADPVTNSVESDEISKQRTGNLCPYIDRKNCIRKWHLRNRRTTKTIPITVNALHWVHLQRVRLQRAVSLTSFCSLWAGFSVSIPSVLLRGKDLSSNTKSAERNHHWRSFIFVKTAEISKPLMCLRKTPWQCCLTTTQLWTSGQG